LQATLSPIHDHFQITCLLCFNLLLTEQMRMVISEISSTCLVDTTNYVLTNKSWHDEHQENGITAYVNGWCKQSSRPCECQYKGPIKLLTLRAIKLIFNQVFKILSTTKQSWRSYDIQITKNIYSILSVKLCYSSSAHNLLCRHSTSNL
jgi:hypothetical protein